jgi:phosphoribosylformimino-5-aminoimidazole carboxamide ribotide isomerase
MTELLTAAQMRAIEKAAIDAGDVTGLALMERAGQGVVEAILAAIDVPAQLGGGIRDMATIEAWLERGLARVILGTVAVENPALVREAAMAFPGKIAVGIDARKGRVATRGPSVSGRGRGRDHLYRYRA